MKYISVMTFHAKKLVKQDMMLSDETGAELTTEYSLPERKKQNIVLLSGL